MSGIGIGIAAAVASGTGAGPLSAGIAWNGLTPVGVSGAAGIVQPYQSGTLNQDGLPTGPYYPNVIVRSASGGVPPYTDAIQLVNNPSGKLSIGSNDGLHETLAWSGFAINEVQSTDITYSVTDSVGSTISATCSGIIIQRTS